jgi:hypothetical protein
MQQPESAAAQTGAARLHHGKRRAYRHRGIECVAALLQDFETGFGSERVRGRYACVRGFDGRRRTDEQRQRDEDDEAEAQACAKRNRIH